MKLIVIGHGMVGHKFLETLLAGAAEGVEVTVLCEEPRPAYDRVHLSEFFAGKSADELSLVAPGFFENRANVTLKLNAQAKEVDRAARTVTLASGEILAYDKLVFATGSYPFVPPVPGKERKDCFVYRTIEDLEAMLECGSRAKSGVVIGGGLLGLECAKALRDMQLATHVVEFAPRLMAVQVDDLGGRMLRTKIEALGVTVHTQKSTQRIVDGEGATHRMEFADGSVLETDMIVFSAGIRPRDELARAAGLALGPRGGIAIDDACLSSDPDIYAIGECAAWNGQTFGLVAPGYDMARTVAKSLLGQSGTFAGADMSTKLKLMGVDVASIGDAHGATPGSRSFQFTDERKQVYKKIVVSDCGKRLLGAVLIGDAAEYGSLLQTALNGLALPAAPEFLILPQADGNARPAIGVDALPAAAQVCSCNDVSKAAICDAVAGGACDIGALKACTGAGTSCGGCVPLVTQIMKAEMHKQGMAVNNHLCEHFPYSRQELHHLIRIGGLHTFGELLHKHGRGLGCDVCKPVAANILASTWADFVLKPEHASLQDSNDYFLGNIQKDGTYSVVPRMPAGEVTADGLIAVGMVAKKYGLYTKITGGARVDLFGARVDQLPFIWEELIAAGFESGHAYGKSLRTVKSCVGSTWCRYGVGDSIGFAIALENRYKGLRSPHKIKFGVSGCTRECAEAQGKDVGLIATEKGWNLYVAGNGGMKPRHAELLAADLDEATVVRLVDRFLMFYVRTADRLQRTSTWRQNLEGGLDYLKQVVVEDKLGIGAELEADMQRVVDTYQDEWKNAVEDPAVRQRFRTFVNSEAADANVVFMSERGQIRPATPEERKQRVIPIAVASI
jgi:nitrite reductase (NADH) large subunit